MASGITLVQGITAIPGGSGSFNSAVAIRSASATSLSVGPNGATNPVFNVDSSTTNAAAGWGIVGAAAAGTPVLTVISSGTNEGGTIQSKGTGTLNLGSAGQGAVNIRTNGTSRIAINTTGSVITFSPATVSTSTGGHYVFNSAADTNMTGGTDSRVVSMDMSSTRQHASNTAVALDTGLHLLAPTIAYATSGGVTTNAATLYINAAPTAGTNATITSSWGILSLGKAGITTTDTTTTSTLFTQVAGTAYNALDWQPAADTSGVRFAVAGIAQHSTANSITNPGHIGGVLGYAYKNNATGTDDLIIGVEGRVGAVAGAVTSAAAVTATFDTNTENAGTITIGVGFYMPDQSDDGHISAKFSYFSDDPDWTMRQDGPALFNNSFSLDTTITSAGTTGNQTINKPTGTVNFAAGASSLTVTNSLCSANSIVICSVRTNDSTALIKNVVPASGSFVIRLNANATAETSVGFWVIN